MSGTEQNESVSIRPMVELDLDAVTAIEQQVSPHPWTRNQFNESLQSSHHCWTMEAGGEVMGFYLYSLVVGEAEILDIAVAPACQGKGLGRQLLEHCTTEASRDARMIFLEVRASNFAAMNLYMNDGFNQIGERRDYYRTAHGSEDALIMAKELLGEGDDFGWGR